MVAVLQVVHARARGRVRYRARAMQRNPQLSARIEAMLRGTAGVRAARANPRTGTLLVLLEPGAPRQPVESLLVRALSGMEAPGLGLATRTRMAAQIRGWAIHAAVRAAVAEPITGVSVLRIAQTTRVRVRNTARRLLFPLPRAPHANRGIDTREPTPADEAPPFHALSVAKVRTAIGVATADGLSSPAARTRLAAEGSNALTPPPRRGELTILLDQLASTPVILLIASATLSVATGGVVDALAILAVVAINAAIGYATESSAERTIAALTRTPATKVAVQRDGIACQIWTEEIVRGDVLLLAGGVFVVADARIVEADGLTVDESSLTGESMPVHKSAAHSRDPHVPLADRASMVYRGTLVTGGSGRALVVATGDRTEIGKIQWLAGRVAVRPTPMQQQLDRLGRQLVIGAGLACAATLGVGLLRGRALLPMFRIAISLGVAAVPEGLPTVAITTLALGLRRLRRQGIVVRQLAAVETLGSVQVVCFDKTGTLTVNRMTVVVAQVGLQELVVRSGTFLGADGCELAAVPPDLHALLRIVSLCSEVELERDRGVWLLRGSPTETALVQMALDGGFDVLEARASHPLLSTQRRAQDRGYMATLHGSATGQLLAVKGRPSEVLELCAFYLEGGEPRPLSESMRARIESDNDRMAARALRVLGVAFSQRDDREPWPKLVWVGLVGMKDPPRDDVADVIMGFRRSGVRTIMLTGDQSATAHAVGKQVRLSEQGQLETVDSTTIDRMDPALLEALAQRADVFSRVSPAHKLQIVQALQRSGQVVAMTGDGVNDGPALKAADIGVAIGGGGSTAACELAQVVLEDGNLGGLIGAIEQGRTIYDDVRKAVHFIVATNLGEILYTFVSAAGLGEPLTPMQLLWINLVTDVFPELALAVEPPEADVLAREPRDPKQPMFGSTDLLRIGAEGSVITAAALCAQFWAHRRSASASAGTVGFTALTMAQLLHAISARSETETVFDAARRPNGRWLPLAVSSMLALQIGANLFPSARALLGTRRLAPAEWGAVLIAAGVPFLINEATKLALRSEQHEGEAEQPLRGGGLR